MPENSKKSSPSTSDTIQQLAQSEREADFVAAVHLAASRIRADLHLEEERTEEIIGEIEKDNFYQEFKNEWEDLTPEEKAAKWPRQLDRIVQIVYSCRPYCMRCGECCSHVSPSLHLEDRHLFDEGILRYSDVYTLRKGEPVHDNIRGKLDNLSQELTKVKESSEKGYCFFYEASGKNCSIYEQRPLQCRTQECWNPDALEKLWSREKLTRRHFIKDDTELLGLLEIHDKRCSPQELDSAIKKYWETKKVSDLDPVVNMLSQDVIIRNFFTEKMNRQEEELDFLLGRPLAKIVEAYNLKVEKDSTGSYRLIQMG